MSSIYLTYNNKNVIPLYHEIMDYWINKKTIGQNVQDVFDKTIQQDQGINLCLTKGIKYSGRFNYFSIFEIFAIEYDLKNQQKKVKQTIKKTDSFTLVLTGQLPGFPDCSVQTLRAETEKINKHIQTLNNLDNIKEKQKNLNTSICTVTKIKNSIIDKALNHQPTRALLYGKSHCNRENFLNTACDSIRDKQAHNRLLLKMIESAKTEEELGSFLIGSSISPSCLEKLITKENEITEQIIEKINQSNFEALKIKVKNIQLQTKINKIRYSIRCSGLNNIKSVRICENDKKYKEDEKWKNDKLNEKQEKYVQQIMAFVQNPTIQKIIKKYQTTIESNSCLKKNKNGIAPKPAQPNSNILTLKNKNMLLQEEANKIQPIMKDNDINNKYDVRICEYNDKDEKWKSQKLNEIQKKDVQQIMAFVQNSTIQKIIKKHSVQMVKEEEEEQD